MTKRQKNILTLLLSFTLFACNQPAEDPKTIADKYWQYVQSGNINEAEKLVSKNSRHILQQQNNRINEKAQINNGDATTIVSTTITTIDPSNSTAGSNNRHTETFNTVLILQQGKWKIDASQSQLPPAPDEKEKQIEQLSNELSESMQKNIDSMDDAVNQGMQLLNEALQDGSKEMGKSLLQLMDELNVTMQQSIDKMKQRREQQLRDKQPDKQQEKQQQTNPKKLQPDPRLGEGMI